MSWKKSNEMRTFHKASCVRVFNRYDQSCPRCIELIAGIAPRAGWNDQKKKDDARRSREIDSHFAPGSPHSLGKCGPVCTAFDW